MCGAHSISVSRSSLPALTFCSVFYFDLFLYRKLQSLRSDSLYEVAKVKIIITKLPLDIFQIFFWEIQAIFIFLFCFENGGINP